MSRTKTIKPHRLSIVCSKMDAMSVINNLSFVSVTMRSLARNMPFSGEFGEIGAYPCMAFGGFAS